MLDIARSDRFNVLTDAVEEEWEGDVADNVWGTAAVIFVDDWPSLVDRRVSDQMSSNIKYGLLEEVGTDVTPVGVTEWAEVCADEGAAAGKTNEDTADCSSKDRPDVESFLRSLSTKERPGIIVTCCSG